MMNKTEKVLKAMFLEDTGAHICDSGGAYGRNHEKNQKRDLAGEPPVKMEASIFTFRVKGKPPSTPEVELEFRYNTYQWLLGRLEFAEDLDAQLQAFLDSRPNDAHYTGMREFAEDLDGEALVQVNTYNHESLLDQTLQFITLRDQEQTVVFLQVHGGCDVRGGYTRPRAFIATDEESMHCDAEGGMQAQGDDGFVSWWFTDDGGNIWQSQLDQDLVVLGDFPATTDPSLRGKAYVYVDEATRKAFCPITGGELTPMDPLV